MLETIPASVEAASCTGSPRPPERAVVPTSTNTSTELNIRSEGNQPGRAGGNQMAFTGTRLGRSGVGSELTHCVEKGRGPADRWLRRAKRNGMASPDWPALEQGGHATRDAGTQHQTKERRATSLAVLRAAASPSQEGNGTPSTMSATVEPGTLAGTGSTRSRRCMNMAQLPTVCRGAYSMPDRPCADKSKAATHLPDELRLASAHHGNSDDPRPIGQGLVRSLDALKGETARSEPTSGHEADESNWVGRADSASYIGR